MIQDGKMTPGAELEVGPRNQDVPLGNLFASHTATRTEKQSIGQFKLSLEGEIEEEGPSS